MIINKHLVKQKYTDILVIDTVGVNKLDFPIEIIVSKDPNNHLQLVAFGYLSGKDTNTFTDFLTTFKQIAEEERNREGKDMSIGKVIVCDRFQAQTNAINCVFIDSKIIFCEVHIMRNIRNNCGINSELYKAATEMFVQRTEKYERKYK